MRNKIIKYILVGLGILILLAIGIGMFYRFVVFPGSVRRGCASEALKYVQNKGSKDSFYSSAEATTDYKFVYNNCFEKNGLRPEN